MRADKYEIRLQAQIKNMKSIRLVANIAFAETTVSGGYDRFYIRSTTGKSRSVTVAHGTYADGTEIAVALQRSRHKHPIYVTVTYVDGRLNSNPVTISQSTIQMSTRQTLWVVP
jgi:putative lipase involved disintegration of autophagic bodies